MRLRRSRRSFRLLVVLVLLCSILSAQAAPAPDEKSLTGFGAESAAAQRALEARFDALLKKENMREWMRRLSARPHHVGSAYDKENAEFMAGLFRSWGYDAALERFDVLFPTPKTRVLELTAPERYTARLSEPKLEEDKTSGQTDEQLPVYNAYSTDGDVTAPLVYVNYGVPRDYEELERRGVDVKGKIVIARYGGSWRGIKPKVAAERGAVGCIIYSDPRDDGYFNGDVYPKGAWRNEWGAQRGSVADMPLFPGDPLTPGVGPTTGAKRLDVKSAPTLTKIPVLPISYGDALPLLKALGGPIAPRAVARRAPRHLSHRPRPRDGSSQARIQLGHQTRLRRYRAPQRLRAPRRVGRARQPPRRMGQRRARPDERHGHAPRRGARRRRVGEDGLEAEAHDHLLRVGRGRAGAARLYRVGRDARRGASKARGRLRQLRLERARLPRSRGLAHAGEVHERSRARRYRPREEDARARPRFARAACSKAPTRRGRRRASAQTYA